MRRDFSSFVFAVVLTGATSCATSPDPAPRPPLGSTHAAPPGTMPPDTRPPPAREAPPVLGTFVDRLRDVGESGREDHRHVIAALEALEEALVTLDGSSIARPRMRHEIEALRASPVMSSLHADHVRMALQMAVEVSLGARPGQSGDLAGYKRAVAAFAEAVAQIDPDRPLLKQHDQVREALVLAADVLYVAIGLQSPLHRPPRTAHTPFEHCRLPGDGCVLAVDNASN